MFKGIAVARKLGKPEERVARREAFCDSFDDVAVEEIRDRITPVAEPLDEVERIARDPYRGPQAEFRARLDRAGEAERTDVFTQLVRNANNPDQVFELATLNRRHANRNGGVPLWALGRNLLPLHPQANLADAQQVSLLLYSCRRFGGCGPDHYYRLVLCANNFLGNCPPGTSVKHNLYLTTSPADFELAQSILARL